MEREQLEVDVLFVGAGPASLAGALHLKAVIDRHNKNAGASGGRPIEDPTILVIEKSREIGAHALSGAVVNPRAFDELLVNFPGEEPPYDSPVTEDALYLLTRRGAYRSPMTPPPLQNHGYFVASLGRLVRWMADLCEKNGIEVYPEFPGVELLVEDGWVRGVRIGDKGRDKQGNPKANFEPGVDVLAKVVVLGEGPRGTLTMQAERSLGLSEGRHPQIFAIGVKEVWKMPHTVEPGCVYHTLGYPLGTAELGGGFVYSMRENLIHLGFVTGLDSKDPRNDGHRLLQQFKKNPWVRGLIEGGKPISYGAKAIPEGGYYSIPRLYANGLLVSGDSAGFLNSQKLKGIHLAVKSGLLAAETISEALRAGDFSERTLGSYQRNFESSWAGDELFKVRNFRQSFQRGFWRGFFHSGLQFLTGGRGLIDPLPTQAGHARMETLEQHFGSARNQPASPSFDGKLTFDKLSDVYLSDTSHEEDQPCHLKVLDFDICNGRCRVEYGNPCQHFCPAGVYEMVGDPAEPGRKRLQVNFTNCVHCKTCDIADPYQIIIWTPPEGGGGPDWKGM